MTRIHHSRPVTALWLQAHDVLCGPAERWLPPPLSMSGTERFRGTMRALGVNIEITYAVQAPWREGETVRRHVALSPALASLGRIECELVLQRTDDGPLRLTFRAETEPGHNRLARVLGPPAARLLLRRFVRVVTARIERAANSRPQWSP